MSTPAPPVVVFAFDGTLFAVAAFLPAVTDRGDPAAWDRFFAAAEQAPPVWWVHEAVRDHHDAGHLPVVLTARSETRRAVTERMLAAWRLPVADVVMCPAELARSDAAIKAALFADVQARHGPVVRAYEDRPSIIRLWRSRVCR